MPENGLEILRYKIERNIGRLDSLDLWRREVEKDITKQDGRLKEQEDRAQGFDMKLDRVQSTLNRLLFTIAAGSVGITVSVLIGSGKI